MNSDYRKCVDWLFSCFPSYQNLGATAYKPGLERVYKLLDALQIDPNKQASIHIAGTNGKGSTAAYCASMLQESGYRVGLFTSPHIYDFSERIRVNGNPIAQQAVIDFCMRYRSLSLEIDASFFELTFAMALAYFQGQKCDYLVIETGLGGRLDATNVLLPKVSVITSIALDHQEFLGSTLGQIASEKAGIIKYQTPVVIGEKKEETIEVFQKSAHQRQAPILFAEEFSFDTTHLNLDGYQQINFNTATLTLQTIGIEITPELQSKALENLFHNTGFFGRLQIWQNMPKIILDVSHNPAGINATLPLIQKQCKGQLYILYGASQDKDAKEILDLFPKNALVAACLFSNSRSKKRQDWEQLGLETIYEQLPSAIEALQNKLNPDDLLWITGSFFLISDLTTQKKIF
jgi:dihydrofolate synthase / folylpolyglutamate synthase